MTSTDELKIQLKTIAARGYQPPEPPADFDLAQMMMRHIGSTDPELRDILNIIKLAVENETTVYIQEEDERLAEATIAVLNRNIFDAKILQDWLHELGGQAEQVGPLPESRHRYVNIKHFLRSFYFQIEKDKATLDVQNTVLEILRQISRF
ncbi:MAG: DUF2785 domain-containing protein [Chloroflexota bacterium]